MTQTMSNVSNMSNMSNKPNKPSKPSTPKSTISYTHWTWAAGHAFLLSTTLTYLGLWTGFSSSSWLGLNSAYTLALSAGLVSYGIRLAKILSEQHGDERLALSSVDGRYFLLCLFWLLVRPALPLALVPFGVISAYHVLRFTVDELLPRIMIVDPDTRQNLKVYLTSCQSTIQQIVAVSEVAILAYVGIGIFWGRLLQFLVFLLFFRLQLKDQKQLGQLMEVLKNQGSGLVLESANLNVLKDLVARFFKIAESPFTAQTGYHDQAVKKKE